MKLIRDQIKDQIKDKAISFPVRSTQFDQVPPSPHQMVQMRLKRRNRVMLTCVTLTVD